MEHIERMDPFTNRNDLMYPEHMARYMFASQFTKEKKVLDCACGNGYGSNYISKRQAQTVIGVDIAEEAVIFSKSNFHGDNLEFRLGDGLNLSFINNDEIDVYLCFETMEHVDNPDQLIVEAKRVLKNDGVFLISCPNDHIFNPENPFHKKTYTYSDFKDLVSKYFRHVAFYVQNNTTGTSILPPEKVTEANDHRDAFTSSTYAINSKSTSNADTWLAVCSDEMIDLNISPTVTFFTTYSQYVQEVQTTIASLYEENQKLAEAWEQHVELIHSMEEDIKRYNEELTDLKRNDQAKTDELEKLSNAWNVHVDYIKKLEAENKRLTDDWEINKKYIENLESKLQSRE